MNCIKLGLVGIGKIARDQHLPAIDADPDFLLTATASRHGQVDGVVSYPDITQMVRGAALDAVSLCTPPGGRFEQAIVAVRAGLHVMLEKPPAATLTHIDLLLQSAADAQVTLFATWHSREAAGVAPARKWLADKRIDRVRIEWREDIRRWHPGQEWILNGGGFGVFDPGINALSIVTEILPADLVLESGTMDIPENRSSPLAASLLLRSGDAPVSVNFDFLQTGQQSWSVEVDTDAGTLVLEMGGSILHIPGIPACVEPDREYSRLYSRFKKLIGSGSSDVDVRPLKLVADAFLSCERRCVPAFHF